MRPLLSCNLDWPRAGPGTLTAVKCRFNPKRVVQPGCTNAQYASGRASTRRQWIQGNRSFCRSHRFALSSPTIQQASRAGQESFASIAAIHRAEGCALVTEEFRSSPQANIEDRLRIALFHACRREWIGEFSVRMLWVSLRASGFRS